MIDLVSKKSLRFTALLLSITGACWAAFSVPAIAHTATAQTERAKQIGGKFMCMCGCNQVLTQCNHVGCTVSTSMLKELDQHVIQGDSEAAITQAFVQEFGTRVYAEPPKSGLSLVAWSLPTIYLVAGTVLVIFVVMRWRARAGLRPAAAGPGGASAGFNAEDLERARQRVTRETED
jgi:cytochrome c-type biogenesis protein CcmH